jgi:beta-lactamase class A
VKPVQGIFAVAFESLDGKAHLFLNEKMMFHAASTMKTPVMIEVFKQSREGRFSLDDILVVRNEFKSIVDGSSFQLDLKDDSDDSMYKKLGAKASIRELLRQMITVSSNLATNLLMDLAEARNVTATMRSLGASDIEVLRGVEDGKAFEKGLNNRTTAFDLLLIMKAISAGKAVDTAASQEMLEILLKQKFNELIPSLLPADVRVAHKTGNITGVEHDSGIVLLPDGRRYVLVILSKELKDVEAGKKAIALISKRIFDFMMEAR